MKNKNYKILLVDDEKDILEILRYNLEKEDYKVYTAKNGIEAIGKANKHTPDLIILDVMMPEMDGITACSELRNIENLRHTKIVFLTARSEDYSQIAGLDAGGDDYISKPIKPKVFLSKVKSYQRQADAATQEDSTIQQGDITIDPEKYLVVNKGIEIILPRKEFELLYLLAGKPSKVFTREEIFSKVWGNDVIVGDRTIDVHIRKIREKIGENIIRTVKGVGYTFEITE
ncbi:MAG: DNA-binding response regulator [Marinilabiliales bacterium]|nr:MAG: DNA-binding response regulator [Marinilabiliales bacterium]